MAVPCSPQSNNTNMQNFPLINRKAVVAGQFYPGNPDELKKELKKLFSDTSCKKAVGEVLAILSPHAGYVFSGKTAACSFKQINPYKKHKTIFLIGSSHHTLFDGASIYNKGNFETPLGIVNVDFETANLLLKNYSFFNTRDDAHDSEHSLEVQLPFLQYYLQTDFKIVPIVIATQNKNTCAKIAQALKPYFNEDNLFIISTDFSHYPDYENAKKTDTETANAILTNNPDELSATLKKNANNNIKGLATSLCGWTSVLTLMEISRDIKDVQYVPVNYSNSGDALYYGDKSRVVGYYSIAVSKKNINGPEENKEFNLSKEDKKKLLEVSRKTLDAYIKTNNYPEINETELSENLCVKCGVFVSLHVGDELRGCVGNFSADISLYKIVQDMTVSSSTRDYRFFPVKENELKNIDIEISVLTPMKKIKSTDEIILGKHGVYIVKNSRSGTFLPQVAVNTGWDIEEFLGHCAKDKAGIGWEGWKDADIYIYEAVVFGEKEFR